MPEKSQKILLTGGAGYIGSHTYITLIDAGFEVVILDNYTNAARDVPDRLRQITQRPVSVIEADVRDLSALEAAFKDHQFDGVVHFAALKAVGESIQKPLDYIDTNISGLTTLLKVMEANDTRALVFSSSATIYGDPETLPIPETAKSSFTNPYALTKLMSEHILEALAKSDDSWRFGILRYFNPVGAHASGMIGEDPRDIPNNLMPYIQRVAIGALPELHVFGDDYDTPDGTGVRDYIHVSDLARAHVLSLQKLLAGEPHLVNIGTGQGYSVLEMVNAYEAASGKHIPFVIDPRRPGDVATVYADPSKAEADLGFKAEKTLSDMCEDSWRWISSKLS
ncbi:MAG: UDP-glucose 4-epimerase GalE [Pseudomonadota bacterium]